MTPERLFRRLLWLLPFDFRADHGRDMELLFRDQHREAVSGGPAAVAELCREAVLDVLRTAPREHLGRLAQDARGALRNLRRAPAFTLAALATLALGIGANTAVFSLVWGVLLKPLPYGDAGRLLAVWNRWDGLEQAPLSDPEYLDYAERTGSLEIAAEARTLVSLAAGGEPERLRAARVTTNLLQVLRVAPLLGRSFLVQEEERDARVAILSAALWRRRFASDPGVVGRTLQVDGVPVEVVGVLAPGFRLPSDLRSGTDAELLLPLPLDRAAPRNRRGGHYLLAVARLADGVTAARAETEIAAVVADLARAYPDEHDQGGFAVRLLPLPANLLGPAGPVLLVLAGAVGLVLLMTCANVASLLLARAEGRRRELAIRSALGADRFRLLRQMLTEAAVLAAAGALLGLAVALGTVRAVVHLAPASLPRLSDVRLDAPVLLFAAGVALLAALVFGSWPALQVSRVGTAEVLGESARGSTASRTAARGVLVSAQVALAAVLLVAAGLLVKSLGRLQAVPSGLDPRGVLTLRLTLPESRYPDRAAVSGFYERLLEGVRTLPGVRTAGAGSGLPLAVSSGDWSFDVLGRPRVGSRHHGAADWFAVTPGWFESLGVRVIRGRSPSAADGPYAPAVAFVNESAARAFFPGEDAVGRSLRLTSTTGPAQPWRTIAGVVADVRHRGLHQPPRPELYLPHAQFLHFAADVQARGMSLAVRVDGAPELLVPALRSQLRRLDPEIPAADVRTMQDVVAGSLAAPRRNLALIGAFALLALLLAAVGLHGLLATAVAERTREIGVRVALGADRVEIVRLVVGRALVLVQLGLAAGLVTALALAGALRELLFEVSPRDLGVLAAVSASLLLVGTAASAVPAWRAARLDPACALRHD